MLNYLGATEYQTGSTGADVREIQDLLTRRGYSPGPVDGMFGAKTKEAVMRFQSDRGIVIDGIVGPVTWAALHGTIPQQPTVTAPAPAPLPRVPVGPPTSIPVASRAGGILAAFEGMNPTVIVIGGLGLLTALSVLTGSAGPRRARRRARR